MKILLLEDDTLLNEIIEECLSENGYIVDSFYDGESALNSAMQSHYDMLLLDVNVPEIDGFEILEYLKELKNTTPAIFITSLKDLKHLKRAFDLGAQDYLKKPFDLDELILRIEHHRGKTEELFTIGIYHFYPQKASLISQIGDEISLKKKESAILEYLLKHRGYIVSTEELISNIWRGEREPSNATIRTYIKNLRKILGQNAIENIKSEGYRVAKAE